MEMRLAPQLPDIDKIAIQQARETLENGTLADLTQLPTTLTRALIAPLEQLIPLSEAWENEDLSPVQLTNDLRENLRHAKKYVSVVVQLIDKSLTLAQHDERLNVLMHVIANDLKSRIILIYSGAELMIDEHPDSLSAKEIEQMLSFMIKGLQRSILYVNKIINLGDNVTMETLHPWRS
ncbi:MAG: hypothetical protein JXA33_20560 [Anaerolineae bacterium]|nr:hypothetical protein [Anaerolineae bacterium]